MKSRTKHAALFTMLLSLFAFACKAQNLPADTFEARLKGTLLNYYKKYPREKIFVHTSQDVYASGETIWYKIYSTIYGVPPGLSKIVYVQLADTSGKLVAQNKLPLNNGIAHGNIDLPDNLRSGWYRLRTFTSWMLNFGADGEYHQDIYIQNIAHDVQQIQLTDQPKKYHLVFYPEGGDLVGGNICNVAFKATDDNGMPVTVYGSVFNNKNQPVAQLVTIHDGMGVFGARFSADSIYTAEVHFPDKAVQNIPLPAVKSEGIAMQVSAAPENNILIKLAYTGPPEKYKNITLAAFQNNGRIMAYPLQLDPRINVYRIKKDLFKTGTLRLTIFNDKGLPEAERLVFINNYDKLNLQLNADTFSSQPRAKEVFNFSARDSAGKPVKGNFSVSVTDADAKVNNGGNNICSYLLLTSELRGYIHDPDWYFRNNSDSLQQQLDLVMLTNGWRHFKWEQVLHQDSLHLHYPVEDSQFIAGRIINYDQLTTKKKELLIKLLIMNQDSSKYIGFVTPDSLGRFILNDYNKSGLANLFMETTDTKNHVKNLKIQLFTTLDDSLRNAPPVPFKVNQNEVSRVSPYLMLDAKKEMDAMRFQNSILLKNVTIRGEKISPTEQAIKDHVSPLYTSQKAYTLDLVSNPTLDIGFINYIRGRFPGLRIEQVNGGTYFIYLSNNTLQTPGPTPAKLLPGQPNPNDIAQPYCYLNEVSVDLKALEDIPMADIALIRFIPPPIVFAPYNGGNVGAILVYTKDRNDDIRSIQSREEFDKYTFNGYTIIREFSSPDYSEIKNDGPPDYRTTLYWGPDLNSNSKGQAGFYFYNSDKAKRYRVIIQGMDAQGRLGYLDEVF